MKIINETIGHPAYKEEVIEDNVEVTFLNAIDIASNKWFNSQKYVTHDDVTHDDMTHDDETNSSVFVLRVRLAPLKKGGREYPSLKVTIRVIH
jgi:hypothetical protein